MTDREYVDFLTKCANIPYKDYSWLKDHCYRTLKRPCSPNTINEHLAILDLIKEHEERHWIPVSEGLPIKNMPCLVAVGEHYLTQIAMYSDLMGIINHRIFYQGDYGNDNFENITEYVEAWMPLPEPYKAEGSVEE